MRHFSVAAALALLLCGLAETPAHAADANLKITVTNGNDTSAAADIRVQVRPAGQHNGEVVTYGGSGDTLTMPAGTYDVQVSYVDGGANKTIWLDRMAITGRIERTVDMGMPMASLNLVITNGGINVADDGMFEVRPAGQHGGEIIAYARSGGTVRVAAGTYDVDASYQDGSISKKVWLDRLALSGAMEKTVEVGAPVADVKWHITNHGADVADEGLFEIRPAGQHKGEVIAYGRSGQQARLPAGDYDVQITFAKGLIRKVIWLDRQTLSGKMDKSTEMALNVVQATLSATLNGADVGDKARIAIVPAGQHEEIGAARGGETVQLEAGRYELVATMPGAEGVLRDAVIADKAHLAVAMEPLRTAELKVGAPAPKECTIEVYGVNFDFNKAVLRPDSEPVLRAVLQLFTDTPTFRAEVGGHTDNVGTAEYNMKLSAERAAAVKAWLVAHSVAADRVTSSGYGDTRPLVPNDTDADRFKNRRVELRRTSCHP